MKKVIAVVVVAVIAIFVVAGLAKSDPGTTKFTKVEVTTTTTGNSAVKAECLSMYNNLMSVWHGLQTTLQEALNTGTAGYIYNETIAAISKGIDANRSWIAACGSYYPNQAAGLETLTSKMEAILASS